MQTITKRAKHAQYSCTLALMICLFAGHPVAAETLDALEGVEPLNKANLAEATGGFILPNGLNINIGIQTSVSVNGHLVVTSNITTNANAIRAANMARVNALTNNSSSTNTSPANSQVTSPTTSSSSPNLSSNNTPSTGSGSNGSGTFTGNSLSSHNYQATYAPASELPTISTQIQSVGGVSQITELTAGQNTIITNTASQAIISQMQRVTINVSNSAILRTSSIPALTALRNIR